eukprot:365507-Chlamydomonas_euryale.AAC.7
MYSSAIRGCHEDGSSVDTTFWDFIKLPGHTKFIPWLEIRAAVAERVLDRQAWRDAIKNLTPLNLKSSNKSDVLHGLALAVAGVANVVQPFLACGPVAKQKIWKLLCPEKPV